MSVIKNILLAVCRLFGIYFENRNKIKALYQTINTMIDEGRATSDAIRKGHLTPADLPAIANQLDAERLKVIAFKTQVKYNVIHDVARDLKKLWKEGELKKIE